MFFLLKITFKLILYSVLIAYACCTFSNCLKIKFESMKVGFLSLGLTPDCQKVVFGFFFFIYFIKCVILQTIKSINTCSHCVNSGRNVTRQTFEIISEIKYACIPSFCLNVSLHFGAIVFVNKAHIETRENFITKNTACNNF